jgi:hypothetical protein
MGQFLSRQATPTRKQHQQHQNISQNRPRRHKRSSETHIGNGRPDARENLKSHRTSSRIRSTNHAPDIKTSLHSLREIDGNVGIPRRQPKYIRGQASKASTKVKDRPRKSDTTQPPSRTKDPKTSRTLLHHSKPAPRHPHPKQIQDCIICTDTRSLHRFPSRPPTRSCTHAPNVCSRCLRTWIETSSSTKIWNEIDCPVCATRMQYDDIRAFAPREVFQRYVVLTPKNPHTKRVKIVSVLTLSSYATLTTTALHDAIPNHRWCLAKGCRAGQVHPPGAPRFRCKTCKKSHCVEHGVAWHKGETCVEYDYRYVDAVKGSGE